MKVSRKVARRSHRSRYSSVSRRRLRSKKSRSGYKKKHAKTQRGGARSRKYGHKRGKRFHRGGAGVDLGSILLEYKKNDGKFLTSSDTKMFRLRFFKENDELYLTRCSGNTNKSCDSIDASSLMLLLKQANLELFNFIDEKSNTPLILTPPPYSVSDTSYTFFSNLLNKTSFNSIIYAMTNLRPE